MMDILNNLSPWHWWALAVLFLAIEIIAPSAFFLWPAAAAAIVGLVLWFQPEITLVIQGLMFAVLAVASLVAWRVGPWSKPSVPDTPLLNQRSAQSVGRRATVVAAFENGRGQINLDDTRWSAESDDGQDIALGTHVEIISADGTLLRVTPIGTAETAGH